jgi:hypothetical protein
VHAPNAKKSDLSERRHNLNFVGNFVALASSCSLFHWGILTAWIKSEIVHKELDKTLLMLQQDNTCSNEYQCSSENVTIDHVR